MLPAHAHIHCTYRTDFCLISQMRVSPPATAPPLGDAPATPNTSKPMHGLIEYRSTHSHLLHTVRPTTPHVIDFHCFKRMQYVSPGNSLRTLRLFHSDAQQLRDAQRIELIELPSSHSECGSCNVSYRERYSYNHPT